MKITTQIQHHFPIRRSVALIGAAILLTTATANAEVKIGRLPSTSEGGGKVVGAKPNVFLVIGNGHASPSFLQQTSAALISSLPVLEGKVRLGYTKSLSDVAECSAEKLNGQVSNLTFKGIEDLKNNKNYVTGKKDFVFGDTGSGFGEIIPRDFKDNFARYIYSWIGAICPGGTSDRYNAQYRYVKAERKQPPYANLASDKASIENYKEAAIAAGNPSSYPLWNFAGLQRQKKSFSPTGDRVVQILGVISDRDFLKVIAGANQCQSDNYCAGVNTSDESKHTNENSPIVLRSHPYLSYFKYDAYANAVYDDPTRDEGFPDDKNPQSCRKNYIILISDGPISQPKNVSPNTNAGVYYLNNQTGWELPPSDIDPTSPNYGITGSYPRFSDETLPYRYLPNKTTEEVLNIPNSGVQGSAGRFTFSKLALMSYYSDLRSNLKNEVPAFYQQRGVKKAGAIDINKEWNRENDPANWQHASFFILAYLPEFPTWSKATIYNDNYQDLNPKYPASRPSEEREKNVTLEGYFRSIENGSIRADNAPLFDWSRGGFALTKYNKHSTQYSGIYIYRKPNDETEEYKINTTIPYNNILASFGSFMEMDLAKAGIVSRGGSYPVNDYDSVKKAISAIADRIETAMAQAVSGTGAVGGGSRVTASAQSAGGNNSTLFTTYVDEATTSGNLFAYRNCPLIEKEKDGKLNLDWIKGQCGQRLWNAASALDKDKSNIAAKTIIPVDLTVDPGNPRPLVGKAFTWDNLDADLRKALQDGSTESDVALGKARLAWLNGKTREDVAKDTDSTVANAASKLRARPIIQIPVEGQRYKLDDNGNPIRDKDGNYTLLKKDAANTPNRIGEIVYATAKTVDPRGTLKAGHPLNIKGNKGEPNDMSNYGNFIVKNVRDGKNEKRKPLVIVGANDGRLYGFTNPKDGSYAELAFSYIPRKVITDGRLKATTKDSWSPATAKSLVNGPFTVTDAQVDDKWGTYLVGTLGAGGSTVYALDISNGEAKFKWEIDLDNGGANTMSAPRIVWLREKCPETTSKCEPKGKWVVLLPSGYNAKDTSLIVLDLKDGSVISRIKTGADYQAVASGSSEANASTQFCALKPLTDADKSNSNLQKLHDRLNSLGNITLPKQSNITCDNGLGDLTVTDADGDGGADYVYAGDLLGYVWKFNLTGFDFANPENSELTVEYDAPLFVAETQEGLRQPITNMIEIGDGPFGEGSMMYFGTGRLFNQEERNITERQSFYGVWENPRYINKVNGFTLPLRRSAAGVYGFWRYEPKTLKNGDYTLSDDSSLKDFKEIRVVERIDNLPPRAKSVGGKVVNVEPEVENFLSYDGRGQRINSATAQAIGWIIDFPEETNKERVLDRSRTFEDMVFFSSFTPKTDDASEDEDLCKPDKPSIGGEGRFYMLNRLTGAPLAQSPFDFNGNGQNDKEGDNIKVKSSVVGSNTTSVSADDKNEVSLSPASIKFNGSANFVELEAVLAQGSKRQAFCDYTRQIIFPGTADPKTGDPLSLTGCYQNRYRVWKQPVSK